MSLAALACGCTCINLSQYTDKLTASRKKNFLSVTVVPFQNPNLSSREIILPIVIILSIMLLALGF